MKESQDSLISVPLGDGRAPRSGSPRLDYEMEKITVSANNTDLETDVSTDSDTKKENEEEFLITWQDEETDPGNPQNWTMTRKFKSLFGMSLFVFIGLFAVSLVAPTLPKIAKDLEITNSAERVMVLSIYLLGFAFGPLIASPLSETYGRATVTHTWNILYTLFNTGCGLAQNKESAIILRFFAGFWASATMGIGGGCIGDLFRKHERGKGIAIYSWCSVAGPLFGVILGGFVAKYTTWRWAYYGTSIFSACIQVAGFFLLEETYAPVLLRRRKAAKIKETGDTRYYTKHDHLDHITREVLYDNFIRPLKLLGTQPIIQVMAIYNAFLFGNTYIFYATFVSLWTDRYGQSVQIAGLNYVSIAVASGIATVIYTLVIDRLYEYLSKRDGGKGRPEFRIPIMIPGTLLLGAGLFWYGWSANAKLHWIMPNIGCGLFVAGATICANSVNAYIIDAYSQYSASAIASISILRCLAGFTFPLFAPYMYDGLGYGWAGSVLGLIVLGIGLPAVTMLWKFGLPLRQRSPYSSAEKQEEAK